MATVLYIQHSSQLLVGNVKLAQLALSKQNEIRTITSFDDAFNWDDLADELLLTKIIKVQSVHWVLIDVFPENFYFPNIF